MLKKNFLKKSIPMLLTTVSAVCTVIFTVICMSMFKSGFLYDHAPVITSLAVCIELIYIAITYFCYFNRFQTVFKFLMTGLIIGACLFLALFVFQVTGVVDKIGSIQKLRDFIKSTGIWAPIVFIVLQALQVFLLPLPGVLTVGAGVVVFGAFWAFIYSYIGIVLGSLFAFWIGRVVGYKAASWLVGKESLDKWLDKVRGKDRVILTAMFVLPVFPDDILCFVAGLSTMSWKYYIVVQLVARALSTALTSYSLEGSIIPYTTWWGILLWILIGVAIIALFVLLYKKGDKIERWFFSLFKTRRGNRTEKKEISDNKDVIGVSTETEMKTKNCAVRECDKDDKKRT